MKYTTPASRAPGESSVGMICEATASTSAASAALNNDIFASASLRGGRCTSCAACAMSDQLQGMAAVAIVAAMACRSDLRERVALSMARDVTSSASVGRFHAISFSILERPALTIRDSSYAVRKPHGWNIRRRNGVMSPKAVVCPRDMRQWSKLIVSCVVCVGSHVLQMRDEHERRHTGNRKT